MKKRLLNILLSFVLVASLLPVTVMVNESAQQEYDLGKGSITVTVDDTGMKNVFQPNNPDTIIIARSRKRSSYRQTALQPTHSPLRQQRVKVLRSCSPV